MSSLYTCRSKKCKNYSQTVSLFVLLGSVGVKALRKMLMKLTSDARIGSLQHLIWKASANEKNVTTWKRSSCQYQDSFFSSYSKFHQHLMYKFFVRTYVLAASTTYMLLEKAAEMTFVQKTRAFYVDEIYTCIQFHQHFTSSFCAYIFMPNFFQAKL